MLKVLVILEDTVLDANYIPPIPPENPPPNAGKWQVRAADAMTGKQHECYLTTEQLGAILALGIGGEEGVFDPAAPINQDHTLNHQLYDVVAEPLKDWPNECRPIP